MEIDIKHGAHIDDYWNQVTKAYPSYVWTEGSPQGTRNIEAPLMPMKNLSFYGSNYSNEDGQIIFKEINRPEFIERDIIKIVDAKGLANSRFNGGRLINGFTWRYVTKPGLSSDTIKYNPMSKGYEITSFYERNKYSLSFNPNNGENLIEVKGVYYQEPLKDKEVQVNQLRDDGYVFGGWYDNPAFIGEKYDFSKNTMPHKNLAFYAKWEAPSYRVSLYKQQLNGDSLIKDKLVTYGENLVDLGFIQKDYQPQPGKDTTNSKFLGWYAYDKENRLKKIALDAPIIEDLEIFPLWEGSSYRVTYHLNGLNGQTPQDNKKYSINSKAIVEDITMQDSQQIFIAWKDIDGKIYHPGDTIQIKGDTQLLAQWTNEKERSSIEYRPGIIKGEAYKIDNILVNQELTLKSPEELNYSKPGYKFIAWKCTDGKFYKEKSKIRLDKISQEGNYLEAIWAKEIRLRKNWIDSDGQIDINFNLLLNGNTFSKKNLTIIDTNDQDICMEEVFSYDSSFKNLKKGDKELVWLIDPAKEGEYQVVEEIPPGYIAEYGRDEEGNFIVNNKIIKSKISIKNILSGNMADFKKDFSYKYQIISPSQAIKEEKEFKLKANGSFDDIEINFGDSIIIEQTNNHNYRSQIEDGSQVKENSRWEWTFDKLQGLKQISQGKYQKNLTFYNRLDQEIKTGISQDFKSLLFVLILSITAFIYIIYKRKIREDIG